MIENSRFIKACQGVRQEIPPVWLMRQAGRYLPEYRELRKGKTMLEAVSDVETIVTATMQPIHRFGFDAAILFSDLTVAFNPMGAKFEIKEGVGPVLDMPVRSIEAAKQLRRFRVEDELGAITTGIQELKKQLKVPLIGFTGAPFTLASYLIEGGPSRDLHLLKSIMVSESGLWETVMEKLSDCVVDLLTAQINAGTDAVQLFDSWIGQLSEIEYRKWVLPYMQSIFKRLSPLGKPVIHFGTGNPTLLPVQAEAGGEVIGVDYRISLSAAAALVPNRPLQGNLDPAYLLAPEAVLRRKVREIVAEGRSLPGHIFNLGHGLFPSAPIESVQIVVDTIREG